MPGLSSLQAQIQSHITRRTRRAQVAQLVEQRTENPRVGGSIPPLGTILPTALPIQIHFTLEEFFFEGDDHGENTS